MAVCSHPDFHTAVNHMFPEWRIWDRFVGEELERALDLDSLRSSHPIEVECKNSADVNEIFDAISYVLFL